MVSAFYISYILTRSDEVTSLAPLKIKAARKTYSKLIVLNQLDSSPSPTPGIALEQTYAQATPTKLTPIPTEIIVAVNDTPTLAVTVSLTVSPTVENTIPPTGVTILPESGVVKNTIMFVSVAGLIIFLSFIF